MYQGNKCTVHPELEGWRYNGGNCPACSRKTKAAYHKRNGDKLREAARRYRLANAEKLRRMNAEWRAKNKERTRDNNLRRIGFTLPLFHLMVEKQKHRCAICRTDLKALPPKQVHADHCHKKNKPRGILCHHCNAALGCFRDNPSLMRRAASYVEKHK